jgi:very-short-patch-repair endonuclease
VAVAAPAEQRPRRDRTESWALDPEFVAGLDRHAAERARGYQVLSVICGDALATQTAWATWAARRGYLTLVTEGSEPAATIADLLAQTPWLRCLIEARKRLAAAAGREIDAVDAELDARSTPERRRWLSDVAAFDRHAQVSGWLLSGLRESRSALDLTTAPAQGSELLAIACDLAAPTAVLLHHPAPTETWLAQAIGTAAALTPDMRRHSVAVSAPDDLVTRVLHGRHDSRALTMARQGRIALTTPAQRLPGRGRSRTMRELHAALCRDPRTRGRFELDAQVTLSEGGPVIDVDLLAPRARIAVELDGWHHFYDPEGYGRDRDQDKRLQRAGYFVMRFLTEDVDERLASTLDQIALALAGRRASGALP